jgi:hypothetical protein
MSTNKEILQNYNSRLETIKSTIEDMQVEAAVPEITATDKGFLVKSVQEAGFIPENSGTFTYEVVDVEGAEYGFALNPEGYWESQNSLNGEDGDHETAAVCRIKLEVYEETDIQIEAVNDSEIPYDFGAFSLLDTPFSTRVDSYDNSGDFAHLCQFYFNGVTNPWTETITYSKVPAGSHFIDVKFSKDSSADYGSDSVKFKVLGGNANPNFYIFEKEIEINMDPAEISTTGGEVSAGSPGLGANSGNIPVSGVYDTAPTSGNYIEIYGSSEASRNELITTITPGAIVEQTEVITPAQTDSVEDTKYVTLSNAVVSVTGGGLSAGAGSVTATAAGANNISFDVTDEEETEDGYWATIKITGSGSVSRAAIKKQTTTAGCLQKDSSASTAISSTSKTSNTATKYIQIPCQERTGSCDMVLTSGSGSVEANNGSGVILGTKTTSTPSFGPYIKVTGSGAVTLEDGWFYGSAGYSQNSFEYSWGETKSSKTATAYYPITSVTLGNGMVSLTVKNNRSTSISVVYMGAQPSLLTSVTHQNLNMNAGASRSISAVKGTSIIIIGAANTSTPTVSGGSTWSTTTGGCARIASVPNSAATITVS